MAPTQIRRAVANTPANQGPLAKDDQELFAGFTYSGKSYSAAKELVFENEVFGGIDLIFTALFSEPKSLVVRQKRGTMPAALISAAL